MATIGVGSGGQLLQGKTAKSDERDHVLLLGMNSDPTARCDNGQAILRHT